MDREEAQVPEAKCDPESSFPTGPVGRRRLTELLLCSGRTTGPVQPSLSSQPLRAQPSLPTAPRKEAHSHRPPWAASCPPTPQSGTAPQGGICCPSP